MNISSWLRRHVACMTMQPLLKKKHADKTLTCDVRALVMCRLREGFTISGVSIKGIATARIIFYAVANVLQVVSVQ